MDTGSLLELRYTLIVYCLALPNAFVDPDKFLLQRFLQHKDVGKYQHDLHEVYKPFSSGPRVCIGREMALQSLRLTTAKLLFKYDIEFTSPDCFIWERDCKSSALWADYRLPVRIRVVERRLDTI